MSTIPQVGQSKCNHSIKSKPLELIVITGGPGAGKTALLEFATKVFCEHIVILPEAASILYSGGFWRLKSDESIVPAQKAIYHIQSSLEEMARAEKKWFFGLCDRGTLDGNAYWPEKNGNFYSELNTNISDQYSKYKAVIHLRTPTALNGYNKVNPFRTESAAEAAIIDEKIREIWKDHPHYHCIEHTQDFSLKLQNGLSILSDLINETIK